MTFVSDAGNKFARSAPRAAAPHAGATLDGFAEWN
jgi:hypothetical protein